MCTECDRLDRIVEQADSALAHASKAIRRLDQMTYSEIRQWEESSRPLRQGLITAKSNRTRHRNKCSESP